jgi:hypothetical protein
MNLKNLVTHWLVEGSKFGGHWTRRKNLIIAMTLATLGQCLNVFSVHVCVSVASFVLCSYLGDWYNYFFRYYDGVVNAYDHVKGKHKVLYDDDYVEQLNLKKHRWELVDANVLPDEVSKNEYNHCLLLYETQHDFVT